MNAQELRIGNLVNYADEICIVVGIPNYGIDIKGLERQHLNGCYDNVEPIPLTEEWLVKFGFEKVSSNLYMFKNFDVNYHDEGIATTFYHNNHINGIGFVHQLQNLYYALTGEELQLSV